MSKFGEKVKKVLSSRSLKYGSNSFIMVAAVIAIAVFANMLAGMGSFKWDLTANKLYSIGDTTKDILSELDKDVTIYGLFDEQKAKSSEDLKECMELLDQYKRYPHIKVQYLDPDKNPGIINQLDPDNLKGLQSDDFVVVSGNKVKKLSQDDLIEYSFDQMTYQQYKTGFNAEQGFTGAIKYVTAAKTPTVYFTEGHEEAEIDSEYTAAKGYIEKNNYEVKTINLLTSEKVPDDAQILVITSPKKDLAADEASKVKTYLENGGNAVFMVDSLASGTDFSNLNDILKDFNISLDNDKVKENDSRRHLPNNLYSIIPVMQSNSINTALNPDSFAMLMPGARSISTLKNQKENITVTSLLKSTEQAVGEQIDSSTGKNINGPLDLAVAVENNSGSKSSKILVIGNGAFMSDSVISQYTPNGLIFFLNSLSWMQENEDDTVIAPKAYSTGSLQIDAAKAGMVSLVLVFLIPLLILGTGLFVWLRRRHL